MPILQSHLRRPLLTSIDRELNRRIMILSVSQLANTDGRGVGLSVMRTRVAELGGNPDQVDHDEVMALVKRGWINLEDMSFGDWLGSITPSGRDTAAQLDAERHNVAQRRVVLRDELPSLAV